MIIFLTCTFDDPEKKSSLGKLSWFMGRMRLMLEVGNWDGLSGIWDGRVDWKLESTGKGLGTAGWCSELAWRALELDRRVG